MSGKTAFLSVVSLLALASSASAAPWDVDMYRQQSLQANEVGRSPVKGTVAIGEKPFTMTAEEADKRLSNPVPATVNSAWRGQRLYTANCSPCHGIHADAKSPIANTKQLPIPNLLEDFYKNRSDGRIFAVIHNGGAVMPRYGFKFSEQEHWDVVNYLRFLQGVKDIPGMKRPE
ncbi:MAG: cytochrome c [Bdellovibrionota bacterium]